MNTGWRRRRVLVYAAMTAGGISLLGNAVASVALPWLVLGMTGSAVWTGVAAAAGMLPLVAGAFFGSRLIDRIGSRQVAVAADLVSAGSMTVIVLLYGYGALSLTTLMAMIALGALFDGPGMAASAARYPELARLARLPLERVTALDELADGVATIAGPVAAGLGMALVGPELTLWMTAGCSLLAAAINACCLPGRRASARRGLPPSSVLTGIRFLSGEEQLRALLLIDMVVVSLFGALDAVVMPVFLRESGRSAADLGGFLAMASGGAIAGALAYARAGHRLAWRQVVLASLALETLAFALLALQGRTPVLLLAGALAGLGAGPLTPLFSTCLLRRAPVAIRGQVLGAANAVALVATPLAVLMAGAAIGVAGTRPVMVGQAVLFALLGVLVALGRPNPRRAAAGQSHPLTRERSR